MSKAIVKEKFDCDGVQQEKTLVQLDEKYFVKIENEIVSESIIFEEALCFFCSIY